MWDSASTVTMGNVTMVTLPNVVFQLNGTKWTPILRFAYKLLLIIEGKDQRNVQKSQISLQFQCFTVKIIILTSTLQKTWKLAQKESL